MFPDRKSRDARHLERDRCRKPARPDDRAGTIPAGSDDRWVEEQLCKPSFGTGARRTFHPALATLLEDTYGVILYQEQVLLDCQSDRGTESGRCGFAAPGDEPLRPGGSYEDLEDAFRAGGRRAAVLCPPRPPNGSGN